MNTSKNSTKPSSKTDALRAAREQAAKAPPPAPVKAAPPAPAKPAPAPAPVAKAAPAPAGKVAPAVTATAATTEAKPRKRYDVELRKLPFHLVTATRTKKAMLRLKKSADRIAAKGVFTVEVEGEEHNAFALASNYLTQASAALEAAVATLEAIPRDYKPARGSSPAMARGYAQGEPVTIRDKARDMYATIEEDEPGTLDTLTVVKDNGKTVTCVSSTGARLFINRRHLKLRAVEA